MIDDQYFNPRAPYGARHAFDRAVSRQDFISIHAPHTGRDTPLRWMIFFVEIFQSTRPIRGATPTGRLFLCQKTNFNPRAPYGARRRRRMRYERSKTISIHAPHTGRDPKPPRSLWKCPYFNPRAPYGARRWMQSLGFIYHSISIHAPHTGRDAEHRKKSEP